MRRRLLVVLLPLLVSTGLVPGVARAESAPSLLAREGSVVQVELADDHGAAILDDGSLWMWGENGFGQLGNGTTENTRAPIKVMENVIDVSVGEYFSAAVKGDGTLWTWGSNNVGKLGDGTEKNSTVPVKIMDGVIDVELGDSHGVAMQKGGSVWAWGSNSRGQVGDGTDEKRASPVHVLDNAVSIDAAGNVSAAVSADGSLLMWGYRISEQGETHSPARVLDNVVSVSLGGDHYGAVRRDGTLWTWGSNGPSGTLGNGEASGWEVEPVMVMSGVEMACMGGTHSAAILTDGSLWMWGGNGQGQLGDGTDDDRPRPQRLMGSVADVALGSNVSAAVKTDGSLWMWGDGSWSQALGDRDKIRYEPVQIFLGSGGSSVSGDPSEPDVWGFANTDDAFGNRGYYITSEDYDRLTSHLPEVDRQKEGLSKSEAWNRFRLTLWDVQYLMFYRGSENGGLNVDGLSKEYKKWKGSCYGMSSWVLLSDEGVLKPGDIAPRFNALADVPAKTNEAVSAINFYQAQQDLTAQEDMRDAFMELTLSEQANMLLDAVSGPDGDLALVHFQYAVLGDDGAPAEDRPVSHVVVAKEAEEGSYTQQVRDMLDQAGNDQGFRNASDRVLGHEFTRRVHVYDPTYPDDTTGKYDLYLTEAGAWCIPGRVAIGTTSGTTSKSQYDNAVFQWVVSDARDLNLVDYATGAVDGRVLNAVTSASPRVTISSDGRYDITWDQGRASVENGMAAQGSDPGISVAVLANVTADGTAAEVPVTAFLPSSALYTVETDDPLDFQFQSDDTLAVGASGESGAVTFAGGGATEVRADGAAAAYVGLTSNSGIDGTSWDTLEVVCDEARSVALEPTSEGVVVSGDRLDGMSVYGTGDGGTSQAEVSTSEDEVLITEEGGRVVARADTNGDGTWETVVSGWANPFVDVAEGTWYYGPVCYVAQNGIMSGYSSPANHFGPGDELSRNDMAVILYRLLGEGKKSPACGLPDVAAGSYYADAINWCVATGAFGGYANGTFGVGDPLTREQLAVVAYRIAGEGEKSDGSSLAAMPDAAAVSPWARDAVAWALDHGVISGKVSGGVTTVSPTDNVSRAEVAAIMQRAIEADLL